MHELRALNRSLASIHKDLAKLNRRIFIISTLDEKDISDEQPQEPEPEA